MSQVAGAADEALQVAMTVLDRHQALSGMLRLFQEWDLRRSDSPGLVVRPHPGFQFAMEYQPSPAASALQYLGKICTQLSNAELRSLHLESQLSTVLYQVRLAIDAIGHQLSSHGHSQSFGGLYCVSFIRDGR